MKRVVECVRHNIQHATQGNTVYGTTGGLWEASKQLPRYDK